MTAGYDYVATRTIYIGGARAFVKGSLVPNSTVATYGYDATGEVQLISGATSPDVTFTSFATNITTGEVA